MEKRTEILPEKENKVAGCRYRCGYEGAGLTHYVLQSEDSPF